MESADFTIAISGVCVAKIVTFDASVTVTVDGAVPVAVPVLLIDPASTSACVVVYVAVHVSEANGACSWGS